MMLPEIETSFFARCSADAVDGSGNPGLEVGRQWDVSERGEALLSFGDGRLHERLHRLPALGIRVFGADNFVARQQDWVGALRSGGVAPREVKHEVIALAFDGDVRDGLADPVVSDVNDSARSLDSGHIEV